MSLIEDHQANRQARLGRLGIAPSHETSAFSREIARKDILICEQKATIDLLTSEIEEMRRKLAMSATAPDPAAPSTPKVEAIVMATCRHFEIKRNDLMGQNRHASYVYPRQVAMYLAKSLTYRSLPEIGRIFCDRDHTTILHAVRKVSKLIASGGSVAEDVVAIRAHLGVPS